MGEIAHVDVDRLYGLAGRFWSTAAELADRRLPGMDPGALTGSVVSVLDTGELIEPQIDAVVAALNDWAAAARASANAFQHADIANGERFGPR